MLLMSNHLIQVWAAATQNHSILVTKGQLEPNQSVKLKSKLFFPCLTSLHEKFTEQLSKAGNKCTS